MNPFENIKIRFWILYQLGGLFLVFVLSMLTYFRIGSMDGGIFGVFFGLSLNLATGLYILRSSNKSKLDMTRLLGDFKLYPSFREDFICVLILLPAAIVGMYVLYYPLSFIWPEFVQYWVLDNIIFYVDNELTQYPVFCNIIGTILILIFAPVFEELFFRGILLQRFAFKWGMSKAVIFSSMFFSIFHADIIGSFLFSILMCIIYMRTKSLYVCMFFHFVNNLTVVLLLGIEYSFLGTIAAISLAEFQSDLWHGILSLIIFVFCYKYFYEKGLKGFTKLQVPYCN